MKSPDRPIGKWVCCHCGDDFRKKIQLEHHLKREDLPCKVYELLDKAMQNGTFQTYQKGTA